MNVALNEILDISAHGICIFLINIAIMMIRHNVSENMSIFIALLCNQFSVHVTRNGLSLSKNCEMTHNNIYRGLAHRMPHGIILFDVTYPESETSAYNVG